LIPLGSFKKIILYIFVSITCRYIDDNGDYQTTQIYAGVIRGAIVPAVTICQQPELIITILSTGEYDPIPSIQQPQSPPAIYGAEPNPTGNPIGGGVGYDDIYENGDYNVSTLNELLSALSTASSGEVVYVSPNASIDMDGNNRVLIPEGVTLASNRGEDSSSGALLFEDGILGTVPMFLTNGHNVRVTGLRIQGPSSERRIGLSLTGYTSAGIWCDYDTEVDNCEISGWPHTGILCRYAADEISATVHAHHNNIHHCQQSGYGYGVTVGSGVDNSDVNALIEANLFDWNRHSIACTGNIRKSYEARYNIVGFHGGYTIHVFDCHGGSNPVYGFGTDLAAESIVIHHNTIKTTWDEETNRNITSILIGGKPRVKCDIYNNWFYHECPGEAIGQCYNEGNFNIGVNQYTTDRLIVLGCDGDCNRGSTYNFAGSCN